ncbi:hypothetical protein EUGRSUZ_E00856 [Eucalyptus grandis]|uniref:Uncharacterized protein n=2 Tax=Eucalyptus grandis TaxID=71139 RepID=A0ACC3KT66_EUCGR|nr:hypothetical protein EUGRSUZ_E00856 [Eucalyptus grandis]
MATGKLLPLPFSSLNARTTRTCGSIPAKGAPEANKRWTLINLSYSLIAAVDYCMHFSISSARNRKHVLDGTFSN